MITKLQQLKTLRISLTNKILTISLNRPKVNALSSEFLDELNLAFDHASKNDQVGGVHLRSNLSSIFCAGLDLVEVHQLCSMRKRPAVDEFFFEKLRLGIAAPFHCSKPVACSLDGHAIAGGIILALACDHIAIGTRKPFRIGLTELLVGVPFPQIPMEIVRHQLEPQLAQRLIFDANTINSNEFTIQCDRTETPDDSSMKWLKMVCDRPLEGFQISKKKWWKSLIKLQAKDNELEKEEYYRAVTSTECLEAMKRTIQK